MKKDRAMVIKGIQIDQGVLQKQAVRLCSDVKCMAACCSDGVWLLNSEVPRIREWAGAVKACLPPDRHDESKWFEQGKDELGTVSVDDPLRPNDTCCVFLQIDRRCALQVISQKNNLGWPGLKPFYCALYPLYTQDNVLLVDNITPLNVKGTMCREANPPKREIYKLFREEIILVLGVDGYQELCERAEAPATFTKKKLKVHAETEVGFPNFQ